MGNVAWEPSLGQIIFSACVGLIVWSAVTVFVTRAGLRPLSDAVEQVAAAVYKMSDILDTEKRRRVAEAERPFKRNE